MTIEADNSLGWFRSLPQLLTRRQHDGAGFGVTMSVAVMMSMIAAGVEEVPEAWL